MSALLPPPPPPPLLLLLLTAPGCSCGPVAVEGNTYAAMAGQGQGCRTDNSKRGWCEKTIADFCGGKDKEPNPIPASGDTCGGQTAPVALRAVTIGGQCNASEPALPPKCPDGPSFAACAQVPGIAGVCYSKGAAAGGARCVSATELAQLAQTDMQPQTIATACGHTSVCTLH